MIIQHCKDPDATYEYTEYGWAFCRSNKVIRYLDQYEVDMIESVFKAFNEGNV